MPAGVYAGGRVCRRATHVAAIVSNILNQTLILHCTSGRPDVGGFLHRATADIGCNDWRFRRRGPNRVGLSRGDAQHTEIWLHESSLFTGVKVMLGADPKKEYAENVAQVRL
jgi:hypothetical protein